MKHYQLDKTIAQIRDSVDRHKLSTGSYARWDFKEEDRGSIQPNPYGCADAANILYTINELPGDAEERQCWINQLRRFQNEDDGLFHEETHHAFHCTAHCAAALELFDAMPGYPVKAMKPYLENDKLIAFMDNLEWEHNPWNASHQGAGLFAALHITQEATLEWEEFYFSWLKKETDEETGFLRKGTIANVACGTIQSLFPHLAGTFHYLFNYQAAKVAHPFPDKLIDSCLEIWHNKNFPILGQNVSFAEIDWVYCLTRSQRLTAHRFDDVKQALLDFADLYLPYVQNLKDHCFGDLHTTFGMLCALAELQQAAPGLIKTPRPLRLVLDRRPFI